MTVTPKENAGQPGRIWTRSFILLNAAVFVTFANVSLFFKLHDYLTTQPVDPKWIGLIIGVFAAVSLILRPFISPWFHPDNGRFWAVVGVSGLGLALASYGLAGGTWSWLAVRTFHGLAHLIMATALMALLVAQIPPGRSGQVFGITSIVILLPNAVVPPLLPGLMKLTGGYHQTLFVFGLLMIPVIPILLAIRRPETGPAKALASSRLSWADVRTDLRNNRVLLLLLITFIFHTAYALVFFYLAGYGQSLGLKEVGFFFTLSTVSEMGIRAVAGSWFDRVNKSRATAWAMFGLAVGYMALAHVRGAPVFFSLGFILGVGWGVAMPLFNAGLYDVSAPKFRAFNTNLGVQMFQGGFFVGPLLGGLILSHLDWDWIFYACATLSLLGSAAAHWMGRREISDGPS